MFDFDVPVTHKSKFWGLRNEARQGRHALDPKKASLARQDSIVLRTVSTAPDELTPMMVACMPDAEAM